MGMKLTEEHDVCSKSSRRVKETGLRFWWTFLSFSWHALLVLFFFIIITII